MKIKDMLSGEYDKEAWEKALPWYYRLLGIKATP